MAVADSAVATLGSTILIPVLANDSDINGDVLVIDSFARNQKATLAIVGTSMSYKPAVNFVGTDFFTYTVRDGRGRSCHGTGDDYGRKYGPLRPQQEDRAKRNLFLATGLEQKSLKGLGIRVGQA